MQIPCQTLRIFGFFKEFILIIIRQVKVKLGHNLHLVALGKLVEGISNPVKDFFFHN